MFDSPAAEVNFAKLGRKTVIQEVKEIFANQPARPKPVLDAAPGEPVPVKSIANASTPASAAPATHAAPVHDAASAPGAAPVDGVRLAAAGLIEAGVRFIESLASGAAAVRPSAVQDVPVGMSLSGLFTRDPRTNRTLLSIPLPESVSQERLTTAVAALLNALAPQISSVRGGSKESVNRPRTQAVRKP